MNGTFTSNGLTLARHLVVPSGRDEPHPGVILCHGFPIGPLDAVTPASSYFWRRAMTIYGGSTEIQKNIMAKHVLGL